jgi:hypothetical protein
LEKNTASTAAVSRGSLGGKMLTELHPSGTGTISIKDNQKGWA